MRQGFAFEPRPRLFIAGRRGTRTDMQSQGRGSADESRQLISIAGRAMTAEILPLSQAITALVHDGDTVALEGFTHLIPFAAGHEIIRQGRRDLTLVRLTPDLVYDQMIGAGTAASLIFSWAGNPGVGSLHRFRDAVENQWPRPLDIQEHSHAGMATRLSAAASGLPFGVLRGYAGTDLPFNTTGIAPISCPFTGETLTAVSALHPDLAIIHAQRADRRGNVQLWGISGLQKEAVLAAKHSLVTVEEVVDELEQVPGQVILPNWVVTAISPVRDGAHPSYASGYSTRDNGFYKAWDSVSRNRETFLAWLDRYVLGTTDWQEYRKLLRADGLVRN